MEDKRKANGQFETGCKGGPGRPKQDQTIKDLANRAPKALERISADPKVNPKIRADIFKWAYEQIHGKATQKIDADVKTPDSLSVTFEGKLGEWSE